MKINFGWYLSSAMALWFLFSSFSEDVSLKHYFPGFLSSRWRNTWESDACFCRRCRVGAGRLMEGLYLLSYLRGLKHYFSGLCVLASLSRDYAATAWGWSQSSLSRTLPGTRVGRQPRPVWRTFGVKISLQPRRNESQSDNQNWIRKNWEARVDLPVPTL